MKKHPFAPGVIDIPKPPLISASDILAIIALLFVLSALGGLLAGVFAGS